MVGGLAFVGVVATALPWPVGPDARGEAAEVRVQWPPADEGGLPEPTASESSPAAGRARPAPALDPGRWAVLPEDPAGARRDAIAVWTGAEVLVVGGETDEGRDLTAATAYNPTTGTWRRLEDLPFPASASGASGHSADSGDGSVYVFPHDSHEVLLAAAYDIAGDSWRSVAAPPYDAAHTKLAWPVWTDNGMYQFAWIGGDDDLYARWALLHYDPAADQWSEQEPPPLSSRHVSLVWSGKELIAWGGVTNWANVGQAGQESCHEHAADGAAYDPGTETWRPLPAAPFDVNGIVERWDGQQLVIVGVARWCTDGGRAPLRAMAYAPASDAWQALPEPPPALLDLGEYYVWTGTEVLVLPAWGSSDRPYRYRPTDGDTLELDDGYLDAFGAAAVWVGDRLLLFGGRAPDALLSGGRSWVPTPQVGPVPRPAPRGTSGSGA